MSSPAISVLMPCYNAAATLDEAVESILRQTRKDIELIAVNDGSSDGSGDLLEAWQGRDARVTVLQRPHEGLIVALNAGLAAGRAALGARVGAEDPAPPPR